MWQILILVVWQREKENCEVIKISSGKQRLSTDSRLENQGYLRDLTKIEKASQVQNSSNS
jgi:hypothetical protein